MRTTVSRRKPSAVRLRMLRLIIALLALVAAPALADWPKPIAPPKSETPAPVPVAPPSGSTPSPIITPATGALPGADAHRALLPLLMEQMQNEQMSPQQAWDDKWITLDDLFWLFDAYIEPWGSFKGKKNVRVRRALAGLLATHGGDRLREIEKLSPTVRLWLADYYESSGDARTLALCESILGEIKAPVRGESALIFQTIERIAWYHRDKGAYEQAAQAWLRLEQFCPDNGWWMADALIEAARLQRQLKDAGQAAELYLRVVQSGPDFFADGALRERVGTLLQQGQTEQVRQWLEQSLRQRGDAVESKYVTAAAVLGRLHYLKDEWPAARSYYTQAVALSERLRGEKTRASVAADVAEAEEALRLIDQWERQRMVCDPAAISIVVGRDQQDEAIMRRLLVSAPHDVLVAVKSSDPRIKALVEDSPWAADAPPLRFEKQVVITIAPEALHTSWETALTISSPSLGFEARVPLRVQVRESQP